jgi:H+/Cl- antiporter ClcA
MTTTKENDKPKDLTFKYNRFLYGAFVALGLYFLLAKKDISTAMSNFGIALVFDPFDQKVMWNNRPAYQQIWLIVHLSIVFGLLGIMLFNWLAK